jgi:hypothetical protein
MMSNSSSGRSFIPPGFSYPGGTPCFASYRFGSDHILDMDAVEAVLEVLRQAPRAYVSFQDHHCLELNENYSNQITVRGIYGFPRDALAWMIWEHTQDKATYRGSGVDFVRRPDMFLFDVEGQILDGSNRDALIPDILRMGQLWGVSGEADIGFPIDRGNVIHIAEDWARSLSKMTHDDSNVLRYMMAAAESMINTMLPVEDVGDGFQGHDYKPELWRAMIASLGYVAVEDRHSILTGDIWQQIVVLEPSSIKNTVQISNPLMSSTSMDLRPR